MFDICFCFIKFHTYGLSNDNFWYQMASIFYVLKVLQFFTLYVFQPTIAVITHTNQIITSTWTIWQGGAFALGKFK